MQNVDGLKIFEASIRTTRVNWMLSTRDIASSSTIFNECERRNAASVRILVRVGSTKLVDFSKGVKDLTD